MKKRPQEIYQVTDTIRKRPIRFYAHLHRMHNKQKKENLVLSLQNHNLLVEINKYLQKIDINEETIQDRTRFRALISRNKFMQRYFFFISHAVKVK